MAERPKISVKPAAAARDPRRRPVRGSAPRPPQPKTPPRAAEPAPEPFPAKAPALRPRATPPARHPSAPRPQPAPVRPASPVASPAPAPEGIRLSKVMTERGLASRREADEWIAAGWVRVDGEMAVLGQRVRPEQAIEIDPRAMKQQAKQVTILVHKPIGLVSGQAEDGYAPAVTLVIPANRWSGDRSENSFHPGQLRHLVPAGRLDIDSTGLLVLTQDGRIAKQLIGDQTRVEKEYLVRVRPLQAGPMPERAVKMLTHGLELDGVKLRPAHVSWQNEEQLRIVLREGRKRQIRRMCELVGLEVLGLKRVRIGSVVLGPLPLGQWRYLGDDERF